MLGNAFGPTIITASPSMPNPVGVTGPAGDIFKIIGPRRRAAGGRHRPGRRAVPGVPVPARGTAHDAQLKWLVYAGVLVVAAILINLGPVVWIMGPGNAANNLQNALGNGAVALVPVAIGVAVLRYRLYDIDRIISRTLAYAIVTGLLIGIYAGLVLLAEQVLELAQRGGGSRRHLDRRGPVQPGTAARAAPGRPAVHDCPAGRHGTTASSRLRLGRCRPDGGSASTLSHPQCSGRL